MKSIIIYGSRYGSARRYAQELSKQTGIPDVSYQEAPLLSELETVVYIGALYAGGVRAPSIIRRYLWDTEP